ncbi:MAG: hypothetical protein JNL28_15940 [Planctomycetes bacterium]|nr:hypothetical protein [Planctomycetota bacterium]
MNWKTLALLCALTAPASLRAQEPEKLSLPPAGDPQSELVELFGKVENRLREIDRMLSDAAAGEAGALQGVGAAGIDELLKQSRASSEEAVKNIDRILEIARQMGQNQSSGSSSGGGQPQQPGPGQQGQDPLGGQEGNTTQRENTPSAPDPSGSKPGEKPGGQKPDGEKDGEKDGDGQKPGQKPQDGNDPKDGRKSNADPRNRAGGPPSTGGRDDPASPNDTRDRWGDLPVHARDVFRNEGGRDMPVQYRDWIDEYYRRLNKKVP